MLMHNNWSWTFFSKIVKKGPQGTLNQKNYRDKKDCQCLFTYARVVLKLKNRTPARAQAFNVGGEKTACAAYLGEF